ncbi:MAG: type II secretion system minor pseudopilin GspK [Aquabacterium sp.]
MKRAPFSPARMAQRGAALLLAMVIVTLVATMAASMVWQQWRSVQVEGSERVRSQAGWVLSGALDWARLILKEDAKTGQQVDHLGEPWALPLAEARLSTFLAADKENNATDNDDSPEAFLSGKVEDAQGKFNLQNLMAGVETPDPTKPNGPPQWKVNEAQLAVLQRLCENIGLSRNLADGIAQAYLKAGLTMRYQYERSGSMLTAIGGEQGRAQAPLMPVVYDDLGWLGLDAGTVEKLRPYVTILRGGTAQGGDVTPVNVNTAPKEVIAAVVADLDIGRAGRLVQARQRKPFKSADEIRVEAGLRPEVSVEGLSVNSEYFEISGRLRYEDNIIEQRHLVHREQNGDVVVLHQSRFSGIDAAAQGTTPP